MFLVEFMRLHYNVLEQLSKRIRGSLSFCNLFMKESYERMKKRITWNLNG